VIKGADFNGKKILSTDAGAINFQVGANTSANDSITVTTSNLGTNTDITGITSASIGSDATTALTATALATVISNLDTALDTVNSERAVLGATQNRFEAVVSNLQVASENTASARIMDADFASETANLSRSQILQQAGTAMVAQANQLPQGVLALLR
jgi:flagellin